MAVMSPLYAQPSESHDKAAQSSPQDFDYGVKRRPRKPRPTASTKAATRETQVEAPVSESPEEEESRLTKNWGGARKTLSDTGVDLALVYKGEFNRVLSGGLRQQGEFLGNVDFRASLDADKLMGWRGGSAFFYVLGNHGGDPSLNVGDLGVTSNIETAVDTVKLYEAWLQQLLFEDRVSFLIGLHDLNSEFYVTDTSGLFFNSSFGIGKELSQTGSNGPSIFPTTAPAIRLRTEPTKSFYFQMAAFNGLAGDPNEPRGTQVRLNSQDGQLLISEFAFLPHKDGEEEASGKYGIGFWMYTKPVDHLTETISLDPNDATVTMPKTETSQGAYLLADQKFSDGIAAFLRLGVAASAVNEVRSCVGTGFVFTGLIPGRSKDRFGLGLAHLEIGNEHRLAQSNAGTPIKGGETTYEVSYRIEAIPGVALQPDFQYVMNPGAALDVSDAKVVAFRVELNF